MNQHIQMTNHALSNGREKIIFLPAKFQTGQPSRQDATPTTTQPNKAQLK